LDLKRSLTADYPVRIAAGGHQFMDLVMTQEDLNGIHLGFDFRSNPVRLQHFGFGIGSYSAELFLFPQMTRRHAVLRSNGPGMERSAV
jgi:hypothetical protein